MITRKVSWECLKKEHKKGVDKDTISCEKWVMNHDKSERVKCVFRANTFLLFDK